MDVSSLFDVRGKVAVVSGGARGIGAMITKALVTNGARVIVVSRNPDAREFEDLDGKAASVECIAADLSSDDECKRVAELVGKKYDQLHILVNNSGYCWGTGAPLPDFPYDVFEKVFSLNVFGVFALTKYLAPMLEKSASASDPARIINISSIAGALVSPADTYAYSSSKSAVNMLTRMLASRLASKHITVNAILPGYFPSHMTASILENPDSKARVVASVPLGRVGSETDIAGAVLYLTSKASNYITGSLIPVDGGMLSKR